MPRLLREQAKAADLRKALDPRYGEQAFFLVRHGAYFWHNPTLARGAQNPLSARKKWNGRLRDSEPWA